MVFAFPLGNGPGHPNAGGSRLRQATGDTRTVADGKHIGELSLQLAAEFQPRGVEFDLHAVEQGIVVGCSRSDLVQGVDHLDDVVHMPFGQHQAQIAGGGVEGGLGEALTQPVVIGADTLE